MKKPTLLALCIAAAFSPSPARAADGWRPTADVRYRYEYVDDDLVPNEAYAQTLRARLGLATPAWHGFSAYAEGEHVEALDDSYNSTANGNTDRAVVADPEATELNQAWVAWAPSAKGSATLGRQRVVFDNQRHFGNVGFRQNEQTFDAFLAKYAPGDRTTLQYAYLEEVHKVFGDDHPNPLQAEQELDAHLVNAAHKLGPGTLVGYGYFVENEDLPATSARTLGVRWTSTHALASGWSLAAAAEYAQQDDYADGAATIDADYAFAELGVSRSGHTIKAGVEILGGDGRYAFQTPFATLHAFNGWADRFLTTPAAGLVDAYVAGGGKLGGFDWLVAFHDFGADEGSADYGTEWDASLKRAFGRGFEAELKAANYDADDFSGDVTKVWLQVTWRH